jgi:hypothetical protein
VEQGHVGVWMGCGLSSEVCVHGVWYIGNLPIYPRAPERCETGTQLGAAAQVRCLVL